jgi:hypothetical protein
VLDLPQADALEHILREVLPQKGGSRRSGRDTRHVIIESATGGFQLHLGGCEVQTLPDGTTHVVTLWDDGQEPPALPAVANDGSAAPSRATFRVRDTHGSNLRQHFDGCCAALAECAAADGGARRGVIGSFCGFISCCPIWHFFIYTRTG